ncbi:uncharacterized protein Z520_08951 [Fonsecaea multimorphosa CBS 102226]|uniref:F-box domain-containing protein n=1 Tax=Fonsecaea multimorphosa CBS 102226 TaxID=1442371 RepID=A0A0D2JY37_9EURO|nr:uncharacterized protein Z520_08951 [Fonsecaea multimorphosa CBS 102226]KIX95434.1 hypothetical protein Z520_08951 [Fonsecaea multimorphosa CBS 102226]OAL20966.1 hypothetical protein AYO22_08386 [Fonsecaea multimorphosa]
MKQTALSTLPPEILEVVVKHISSLRELNSLARVSKYLYTKTLPFLYESLSIECVEGLCPRVQDLQKYYLTAPHCGVEDGLHFVKHLTLTTKDYKDLTGRCYHNRAHDLFTGDYLQFDDHERQTAEFHLDGIPRSLGTPFPAENTGAGLLKLYNDQNIELDISQEWDFVLFCHRLRPSALKSFSWDLGTCVPLAILGVGGYLGTYQEKLERLSLSTDGECDRAGTKCQSYDLSKFTNLTEVSWVGIQSTQEITALQNLLEKNAHGLRTLSLKPGTGKLPMAGEEMMRLKEIVTAETLQNSSRHLSVLADSDSSLSL